MLKNCVCFPFEFLCSFILISMVKVENEINGGMCKHEPNTRQFDTRIHYPVLEYIVSGYNMIQA